MTVSRASGRQALAGLGAALPLRRLFVLLLISLTVAATAAPATAQLLPGITPGQSAEPEQPPEEAGPPDPADLQALARLISDDRIRQWLAEQAQAQGEAAAAAEEPEVFRNWLHHGLERIRTKAEQVVNGIRAMPAEIEYARTVLGIELGDGGAFRALLYSMAFLAVGLLLEQLFWRATAAMRKRIVEVPRTTFINRLQLTGMRILFSLVAVGVFGLGSLGTFVIFDWQPIIELLILTLLWAFVLVRLAGILSRLFLAPTVPNLRLVPISCESARFLHHWVIAITAVAAFGFLSCVALFRMGLLMQSHALLISSVGLVMAVMVVAMIWLTRRDVSALIAPPQDAAQGHMARGRVRSVLADLWPFVATGTTVVVWALWTVGATRLMWTVVIFVAMPVVFLTARGLVELVARPAKKPAAPAQDDSMADADAVEDGAEQPAAAGQADDAPEPSPYLPAIHRLVRVVLVLLIAAGLAHTWGVELAALAHSMSPTARTVRAIFNIGITLLIADFIWQLIRVGIDRRLKNAGGAPDPHALPTDGEGGGAADPHARVRTLLPLVRKTISVVLVVMVAMLLLSSMGVDIGPLLAGAGVVGIAVGFGAQALVRDIVSGVFFLIDDAFRLGEYVEIGELRGTVEGISIRSLKLRHHRGAVHTVPFGEVRNMTNYSRDWVIMKLEFRVPFDTDLSLVKKIVKQIGKELLGDPTLGASFIEPLKSQGVRRWEEFNMVVGVKFMAKPGQQFLIRKEAYQRIRDAFETNGIHFAQRQVTVQVAKDATPEDMEEAVSAAAQDYLEVPPTDAAKQPSAA